MYIYILDLGYKDYILSVFMYLIFYTETMSMKKNYYTGIMYLVSTYRGLQSPKFKNPRFCLPHISMLMHSRESVTLQ